MNRLANKVAIITGGSTGIGLATAQSFLNEGAKVVIFARNQVNLDKAVLTLNHSNLLALQGDITNLADIQKLIDTTFQKFGKIDVLVLNAADASTATLENITEEHFDTVMKTNLKSPIFTIQKALPYLNNPSSLVLVSSIADQAGFPSYTVYSASKAGLRAIARNISTELIGRGVRVNVVAPTITDTPIWEKSGLSKEELANLFKDLAAKNPSKRIAKPQDIANAILFLASDESSYIVGAEINVDGGTTYLGI